MDMLIPNEQEAKSSNGYWDVWLPKGNVVTQGSVIGPALFAVFINGLPEGLNSICKMFADETKLIATIRPRYMLEDRAKLQLIK